MSDTHRTLLCTVLRLAVGTALFVLPALFFWLDARDGGGLHENGCVEIAQVAILILSGILFAVAARRSARAADGRAPALLLVVLGIATMAVRELDGFFDTAVSHGSWKLFVAPFGLAALVLCARRRRVLLDSLVTLLRTRAGHALELFALTLLAFSRTIGMKVLWNTLFAAADFGLSAEQLEHIARTAKNAMEEGTELFAYLVLLLAALFALRPAPRD